MHHRTRRHNVVRPQNWVRFRGRKLVPLPGLIDRDRFSALSAVRLLGLFAGSDSFIVCCFHPSNLFHC